MSKINFSRNISLEKEELVQLQNFIIDNSQKSMFQAISLNYGIIPQADLSGNDFLVVNGSLSGTIAVGNDSVGIDSDLLLMSLKSFDNYPIPNDSNYYWLKISHRYLNVEPGTVSINTAGEVSGTGTNFTELLRNQTTGSPIKIRFYKEDVSQVEQTVNNGDVYEIVEIINDGSMVLSGNFVVESDLKYIIVGTVSLGTSLTSTQEEGIYSYDNCSLELVAETVADTAPATGFTEGKDFYIARIVNNSGTVTVEDKRANYYWTLDLGVTLPSKAERDASNITGSDVPLWLEKLMVYQNNYITLTSTSTPTVTDIANTTGLINLSGSATTHSYRLRLPVIGNTNLGKEFFIKYNLSSTTASSSYFRVSDSSNNNIFELTWSEIGNQTGAIVVKNNGTTWGLLNQKSYNISSTSEAQTGTNNTTVLTPAKLQEVTATTTRKGIVEFADETETEDGGAGLAVSADNHLITKTFRQRGTYQLMAASVVVSDNYDIYLFGTSGTQTATMPDPTGASQYNRIITLAGGDPAVIIEIDNTSNVGSQRTQFYNSNGVRTGSTNNISGSFMSFISDGRKWMCIGYHESELACPYIYINGVFVDEILKNQKGIENYREEVIDITSSILVGDNTIRLSEEKPETTFIDYLIIIIDGKEYPLFTDRKILERGDYYDFTVKLEEEFSKIELKAKGYYTN